MKNMYQYLYNTNFYRSLLSKNSKKMLWILSMICIAKSSYSQTFPVLPSPNYNVDHSSLVRGVVSQNGGAGIPGILVKLKSADGSIISNSLTNDQGAYELSAKAETGNYTIEIEYPSDGYSISSSPSAFPLSGNQIENGKNFTLERTPNTLTVCDVHSLTLTPWGLSSSIFLDLQKPNISIPYTSVKLFTSATTTHPELQISNTNTSEPARVTRLDVGAIVYHEAPSSSSSINSAMEFAKNNIGGSQNLVVPPSTTYNYYDISSGKTWSSANLSNTSYATDGSNLQIQIAASAEITSTITGGNATFSVATNANAGACLVYTYPSDPLPVRLISFDVVKSNGEPILLKWKTAEETVSKEFQIERSSNARDWKVIGAIPTTNRGVAIAEYQMNDIEIQSGTIYYRLKMLDQDNSFSYSQIRSIKTEQYAENLIIFPNPISLGQNIKFNENINTISKIEFISISGFVAFGVENLSSDEISIDSISKGIYVVKMSFKDGKKKYSRLIIN